MWNSARYYQGRRVWYLGNTIPVISDPQFGNHIEGNERNLEKYLLYDFEIQAINSHKQKVILSPLSNEYSGHPIEADMKNILKFNHPEKLGCEENNKNKMILEDGLRVDPRTYILKCKIYEIAYRLSPIIQKMNFSENHRDELLNLQIKAIKLIRGCLNLTSFYKGVDNKRVGRTDNVGNLVWNGQGQCHGCSSTMATVLIIFGHVLGIDMKYRGGTSFRENDDPSKTISNNIEMHQWLEVTMRPSYKSFVVDLWYHDVTGDDKYLAYPLEEAVKELSYPHPKILLKNELFVVETTDIESI